MERRFIQNERSFIRLAQRSDGKTIITGYGSVFYDGTPETEYVLWDDSYGRAVERIMPTAFDSAIGRDDVRGLFNHDPNMLLGRTQSGTMLLSKDSKGLKYEIEPGDTSVSRDVKAHLERKDLTGSSFSFTLESGGVRWETTQDKEGRYNEVREILAVTLYDVGPVTFPAYPAASSGLRAARSEDVSEMRKAREAINRESKRMSPEQFKIAKRARDLRTELTK